MNLEQIILLKNGGGHEIIPPNSNMFSTIKSEIDINHLNLQVKIQDTNLLLDIGKGGTRFNITQYTKNPETVYIIYDTVFDSSNGYKEKEIFEKLKKEVEELEKEHN